MLLSTFKFLRGRIRPASSCLLHVRLASSASAPGTAPAVSTKSGGLGEEDVTFPSSFSFISEPLGEPGANGHGWARFQVGQRIGAEQSPERYTILRKLGWGGQSSTWLVRDAEATGDEPPYVAVKALNGYHTHLDRKNVVWEQDALRLLGYHPRSPHCMYSTDTFTVPGVGASGDHLCMTMPLMGGDVKALIDTKTGPRLPFSLARRIILHLLRGIAHAHSRGMGVVHTDLKAANIFFKSRMTTSDIDAWLDKNPARLHEPEMSSEGLVRSYVSQPLPMISMEDAMSTTFVLGDFGTSAQPSKLHSNRKITAAVLRAPEVHLGGEWDLPADIWSFGCIVYELVTHFPIYNYGPRQLNDLDTMQHLLHQMVSCSAERSFPAALLQPCPLAPEYFNADCSLKTTTVTGEAPYVPYWARLVVANVLEQSEAIRMSDFMYRCLALVPEERATAEELLQDDWMKGAGDD